MDITGLRKNHGDVRAMEGFDLMIAPGEVLPQFSPDGVGESPTVDMLLGLTRPDSGKLRIL